MLGKPVEEDFGGRCHIAAIPVAAFFREGEAVEPVEQVFSGCREHTVLREMDMGVDQAWHDEHVTVIIEGRLPERLWKKRPRPRPQDCSIIAHRDSAIGFVVDIPLRFAEGNSLPPR